MSKYGHKQCKQKKCGYRKQSKLNESRIALMMVLLGIMAIFSLCLPLKYWIIMLSIALITFGIILLKT